MAEDAATEDAVAGDAMAGDYTALMADAAQAAGIAAPAIVQPTDHEVSLGGLRFHYLDWGNAHLPHVVLLHGGSLTAHTWDMAALLLRDRYHLVALDQRGHGDSDWTPRVEDDTSALMVEDTRAFLDHLGYEHFALVGMSMGGINAIQYAAGLHAAGLHAGGQAEALDALVVVDVGPEVMRAGVIEMEQFAQATETLASFEDFLERAVEFNPDRAVAHLRYSLTHALKQTAAGWTWKNDRRERPKPDEAALKRDLEARAEALWAAVRAIETPTLLVRGAESKILSAEHAAAVVAAMPHAQSVVIPGARHTVQGDNPGDFASALDAYLQHTLPRRG
ncbi:MAG: alpha/beta hydrolase [Chloroflexi bacterium]|nr:alpha/beta hydrolase [Chloroflexota bacterium]